jgi:hypothetical protein
VPFSVDDNDGLVRNLNADKVDGLDAEQLRGQTGPPGPQGPRGETGPQGPPGPTASASVSDEPDFDLPQSNTIIDTAVLRTTITTRTTSRIVATATGEVVDDVNSNKATCWLTIEGPGVQIGDERMSQSLAESIAAPGGSASVAVTGASVRPAGTYDVELHCIAQDTGMRFDAGDLTVVAAAV